MAGLLRKIVSTWNSGGHPMQGVSALLKPLTLVDAQRVWNSGLWSLEEALASEGSRLRPTRRDSTLLATGNAAARLHPYSCPLEVPAVPPGVVSTSITLRTSRLAPAVDHDTAAAYLRLIRRYGDKAYPPTAAPPSAVASSRPPTPIALPAGPQRDRDLRPEWRRGETDLAETPKGHRRTSPPTGARTDRRAGRETLKRPGPAGIVQPREGRRDDGARRPS